MHGACVIKRVLLCLAIRIDPPARPFWELSGMNPIVFLPVLSAKLPAFLQPRVRFFGLTLVAKAIALHLLKGDPCFRPPSFSWWNG